MNWKPLHHPDLLQLLRIDTHAYSQAMALDPLLPRELHPKNYLGEDVFSTHQKLTKEINNHRILT